MAKIDTTKAVVATNVGIILKGLDGGVVKSGYINDEKDAKKLLKETLKIMTLNAAITYIQITGGVELTTTQHARLKIWYRDAPKKAELTLETANIRYASLTDDILIGMLKARGYTKIAKR